MKKEKKTLLESMSLYIDDRVLTGFNEHLIVGLDCSTTCTGHSALILRLDTNKVEVCDIADIRQHIVDVSKIKMPAGGMWPGVNNRVATYEREISRTLHEYVDRFASGRFVWLAVESVFIGIKSCVIPLARFQNTAINIARGIGYVVVEYSNQESKEAVGANGKKDLVTDNVNSLLGTHIPNTDLAGHVADSLALAFVHSRILYQLFVNNKEDRNVS